MKATRQNLLIGGLVLAALILGSWVVRLFPNPETLLRQPFEQPTKINQLASLRTLDAKVTGVVVAKEVKHGVRQVSTTTGKFVIVQFEVTSRRDAQPVQRGRLVDSAGNSYSGQGVVTSTCGTAQPGIRRACESVFEVPADADGFTFRLPTEVFENQDDVLVVALGPLPTESANHENSPGRTIGAVK